MDDTNVRNRKGNSDKDGNPSKNDDSRGSEKGVEQASESGTNGVTCMNYGSADAYAQAVRTWLLAYHAWTLGQYMAPLHAAQQQLSAAQQAQSIHRQTHTPTTAQARQAQGREYRTASFGRRIVAELIDFFFCFALKLVIVYAAVELNLLDLEPYDKLLGDYADLQTLIDVTQDLFPLEVLYKIITSLIEAVYISYGLASVPRGCTPGKLVMGIRVISCLELWPIETGRPDESRVTVHGFHHVPFKASVTRSIIKNLSLSFAFPLCIVMYAFRYNRSVYDKASKTLVVQL